MDTYKGSVKDQIQIWFQQLKRLEFQDWLLVLVETAESKKTSSKILPRTTVLDRLKSDFGGKTTERYATTSSTMKAKPIKLRERKSNSEN